MNKNLRLTGLTALTMLLLACTGGGNNIASNNGGIGGSGAVSRGSIDGFGSIFVNGVKFETGTSSILLDDTNAQEDDLKLGMVVTVLGDVNSDGETGTATTIIFDDDVQGPIDSLAVSADGNEASFNVLGLAVSASRTSTIFDAVSFDTLANNDVVEVSGFEDGNGTIIASRIEKKSLFVPDISEVELKGTVSSLSGSSFILGAYSILFSGADTSDVDGGVLTNGMPVEVKGTLNSSVISATRIKTEDDIFGGLLDAGGKVSLEGIVSNYVSDAQFTIQGITVDASQAIREPTTLIIGNNISIEAEGFFVNGILEATKVEQEDGEIEIAGHIQQVLVPEKQIIIQLANGSLTITLDNKTRLKDQTGALEILTLNDLVAGDYLEVEAFENSQADLLATELRRDSTDDDIVQGPTDTFVSGAEVTVLGLTYTIAVGVTEFEDLNDTPVNSSAFFASLQNGDLIKIRDDSPADGVADKIERE